MNFDLIQVFRQSGLYQRFQSRGLNANQGSSANDGGHNGIGADKAAEAKGGAFGSAFNFSLSSVGAQLGAEQSDAELTEEQLRQIGERIAKLQKAQEEAKQGEGRTNANVAAESYAVHSNLAPTRKRRHSEDPPAEAAPTTPAPVEEEVEAESAEEASEGAEETDDSGDAEESEEAEGSGGTGEASGSDDQDEDEPTV